MFVHVSRHVFSRHVFYQNKKRPSLAQESHGKKDHGNQDIPKNMNKHKREPGWAPLPLGFGTGMLIGGVERKEFGVVVPVRRSLKQCCCMCFNMF